MKKRKFKIYYEADSAHVTCMKDDRYGEVLDENIFIPKKNTHTVDTKHASKPKIMVKKWKNILWNKV